ncbi:hypothetical protein CgIS1_16220 [Frankia sp. CgS1]|nr:hypothetical protein CgIS1_16220 [Frankia sp. CgIS1]
MTCANAETERYLFVGVAHVTHVCKASAAGCADHLPSRASGLAVGRGVGTGSIVEVPDEAMAGSATTMLVVIRGNSGAGKSSVARALRARAGRGVALVELSDRPPGARDVCGGVDR